MFRASAVCLCVSMLVAITAMAQIASRARDIVIERPADLPQLVQQSGTAFYLNTDSGNGRAYLYVEQFGGQHIAVLDVTDLSRVKLVQVVNVSLRAPFEFGENLGDSFVMLRSRDNMKIAVLNIRSAKAPVVTGSECFQGLGRVTPIGQSAFLTNVRRSLPSAALSHDYQVVDLSDSSYPTVLYTAKSVTASITREETGTIFLLGSGGLTIVRHPKIEQEYEASQRFTN